jgi:hypothetical protein
MAATRRGSGTLIPTICHGELVDLLERLPTTLARRLQSLLHQCVNGDRLPTAAGQATSAVLESRCQ